MQRRCTGLALAAVFLDFYTEYIEQGKYKCNIPVVSKFISFLKVT